VEFFTQIYESIVAYSKRYCS